MKILYCCIDRSKRAANHFDDFRKAFCNLSGIKPTVIIKNIPDRCQHPYDYVRACADGVIKNKDVTNICQHEDFDIILVDAPFAFLYEDWQNIKIPTYFIIEDEHGLIPQMQVKCAELNNINILYRYSQFLCTFPNLTVPTHWLPHSVNINRFKPKNLKKKYNILQTGVITERNYPLRAQLHETLKDHKDYTYIPRPVDGEPNPFPIDEDYVRVLNQSKIVVTGLSKFNYPIMKVFEIAACNCILACNYTDEMRDLGFYHTKNMIEVIEPIKKLTASSRFSIDIIKNANKLIKTRHTNEIRAKELLEYLCKKQ